MKQKPIITTFEHAILTQADFTNPTDFDWLIEQNFDVFQILRKNHQWQLKIRHYIGVIGLPSGYQLEILPKISDHAQIKPTRQWLQRMLTDIWQAISPKQLANISKQQIINHNLTITQWLAEQFWQQFQRYQTNQHYQNIEQNQPFLQGQIQLRSATHPKLDFTSRGVLNPSTFLGRLFKLSSIAWI